MSVARCVAVLLMAAASACGGAADGPAQGPATDEQVADVSALYVRKCAGCHGAAGTDQAATSLASFGQLSPSEIEEVVRFGGDQMPGFGESLNEANIAALVDYMIENFSP